MNPTHTDFADLVARYQGVVCAVAYAVLRDHGLSEEVAQEAFLLAWQRLPEMTPAPTMPGWVCGIARNLARNAARRRKEIEMTDDPIQATTALDHVLRAEANDLAQRALATLSEAEREAVVLYYRSDASLAEVATVLGISEAAAKKRVLRGRDHLRTALEAVEQTLRTTRPGPAFTAGCVAALAIGTVGKASAASLAAVDAAPTTVGTSVVVKLGLVALLLLALAGVVFTVARGTEDPPPPPTGPSVAQSNRAAIAAPDAAPRAQKPWSSWSRKIDLVDRTQLAARIEKAKAAKTPPREPMVFDFSGGPLFGWEPVPYVAREPGPFEKGDMRKIIKSAVPFLRECYTEAAPRLPATGTINMRFRLEGDPDLGTLVTEARLENAPYSKDAALVECIQETLFSLELPGITDTYVIDVTYPLEIK